MAGTYLVIYVRNKTGQRAVPAVWDVVSRYISDIISGLLLFDG